MEIIVRIKNVFGNETIYPVCDKAKLLAQIANTTTLTKNKIELIKKLGYSVKVQQVGEL